jgi:S-adenosylmethionine-diacylglycerol 3-amino-3-carboxypropyl transferase
MSDRKLGAPRRSIVKATHDLVFKRVHGTQLIYNCAWEDPRIDRELMKLDASSSVVMITSAGCNALDYLLDGPAAIHAIDMNFRQNAVLELKLALIKKGDHAALFEMFGKGATPRFREIYAGVREDLPADARSFWDEKIAVFDPNSFKRSFYYHGTSGTAAWVMRKALFAGRHNLADMALCLLESESLEEQRDIYRQIEPEVWGRFANWLVRQPALMALLGVPRPQMQLIQNNYPGGLTSFVKDKLKRVLTEVPVEDNYFWRVYMTGNYTKDCAPGYLHEGNLAILAANADRAHTHTMTVSDFLKQNPGAYSHYVLLDHQDWLAAHDPAALREEWELILANSRPGTKVLMRSAGFDIDFVPEDIRSRLRFCPEITERMHLQDRVGTYGSLHFGEVL